MRGICAGIENAYPVNFNSPAQTVVACAAESEEALLAAVKAAGGRAMKLAVSGAFHSPFMADASDKMRSELEHVSFNEPLLPLYANRTAQPYVVGAEVDTLSAQISSPVLWNDTVENMWQAGVRTFARGGRGQDAVRTYKEDTARSDRTPTVGDAAGAEALTDLIKGASIC